MKKLLLLVVMIVVISSSIAIAKGNQINLVIDGKDIVTDVNPVIVNDRTLVPVRVISESLGAKVDWNDKLKEVTLSFKDSNLVVKMKIGSRNYSVNGNMKSMDVAPQIINERTMVPIRFISETLGFKVDWDDFTKRVFIYSENDESSMNSKNLKVTLVE